MTTAIVEANCFGPFVGAAELWWLALSLGVMTGVHARFEPHHLRWSIPYALWAAGWAVSDYSGASVAFIYRHLDWWFVHPALWPVYALGAAVAAGPALGLLWRRRDLPAGE